MPLLLRQEGGLDKAKIIPKYLYFLQHFLFVLFVFQSPF